MILKKTYKGGYLDGVLNAYGHDRALIRTEMYKRGERIEQRCFAADSSDTICTALHEPVKFGSTYQASFNRFRNPTVEKLLLETPDTVVIGLHIGIEGNIFWPKIEHTTNKALNDEAVRLSRTLKIYPARDLGEMVNDYVRIPIVFARKPENASR